VKHDKNLNIYSGVKLVIAFVVTLLLCLHVFE